MATHGSAGAHPVRSPPGSFPPPDATVVLSLRPLVPSLLLAVTPALNLACASGAPTPPAVMAPVEVVEERPQITTVVEGLEHPWGMAWLPGGEILITGRPGRLRIVRDGRLDPRPLQWQQSNNGTYR